MGFSTKEIVVCSACDQAFVGKPGKKCPHCADGKGVRLTPPKKNKYGAVRTSVDGRAFDSKKEAGRYQVLKSLEDDGRIMHLKLHPAYELVVAGVRIGKYTADFEYTDVEGKSVVEDVKSEATRRGEAYRLRKKLFEALYRIEVTEI